MRSALLLPSQNALDQLSRFPRPISFPHVKNCSRNMLNIDENDPRLLEIFNHYGEEHQRFKCAEECMELMAATFRYAQIDFDLSLTEEEKAAERQKQIQSIESEIADVLVVTSEFIAAGKTKCRQKSRPARRSMIPKRQGM